MSFCSTIKNELSDIKVSSCCKMPLIYGFLLFSRSFSFKKICMQTENEKTAKLYAKLLSEVYSADVKIEKGGKTVETFRAQVINDGDILRILASVDFGIYENLINEDAFLRECCKASFIRGAFLACGHLADPNKCYRVDFYVKDEKLAQELVSFLSHYEIEARISIRAGAFNVYIKKSETVINLLTLIGASARSLELIETTIIKSVKNNMNRASNCDNANINKTVEASLKQRNAIRYLEQKNMLETLPSELVAAAKLRMEYPELSLKQLCKESDEPITVSGLNHRLKRIMDIYNEKKK